MSSDHALQKAVEAELSWEPEVDAAHIGVTAHGGIVTLSGHVQTYQGKRVAEQAACRVKGVKAVVEEIAVELPHLSAVPSDEDIAAAVIARWAWDDQVPKAVKVKVEKGWVTLSGQVEWHYQRQAAEYHIRSLRGVRGVSNEVSLRPRIDTATLSDDITHALHRSWFFDPQTVMVTAQDRTVWLKGTVKSDHERQLAAATAWKAPGVGNVVNELKVV